MKSSVLQSSSMRLPAGWSLALILPLVLTSCASFESEAVRTQKAAEKNRNAATGSRVVQVEATFDSTQKPAGKTAFVAVASKELEFLKPKLETLLKERGYVVVKSGEDSFYKIDVILQNRSVLNLIQDGVLPGANYQSETTSLVRKDSGEYVYRSANLKVDAKEDDKWIDVSIYSSVRLPLQRPQGVSFARFLAPSATTLKADSDFAQYIEKFRDIVPPPGLLDADPKNPPGCMPSFGFDDNSEGVVTRVYSQSGAQKAGLKVGDKLHHVDGVPRGDRDWEKKFSKVYQSKIKVPIKWERAGIEMRSLIGPEILCDK